VPTYLNVLEWVRGMVEHSTWHPVEHRGWTVTVENNEAMQTQLCMVRCTCRDAFDLPMSVLERARTGMGHFIRQNLQTASGRENFERFLLNLAVSETRPAILQRPEESPFLLPEDIQRHLTLDVQLGHDARGNRILHNGRQIWGFKRVTIVLDFENGEASIRADFPDPATVGEDVLFEMERARSILALYGPEPPPEPPPEPEPERLDDWTRLRDD
jgi:hypothetical protein